MRFPNSSAARNITVNRQEMDVLAGWVRGRRTSDCGPRRNVFVVNAYFKMSYRIFYVANRIVFRWPSRAWQVRARRPTAHAAALTTREPARILECSMTRIGPLLTDVGRVTTWLHRPNAWPTARRLAPHPFLTRKHETSSARAPPLERGARKP